jgi:Raf kinase inhibitor-like YbhB/YbcL family protein
MLVAALVTPGCATAVDTTVAPEPAEVTSSAFADGAPIPPTYTCDGADVSPALTWEGVHPDAQELVLVMEDDDADVRGRPFVHWQVTGLSPTDGGLDEGRLPPGAVEGRNDFDTIGWRGPCPPPGDGDHTYRFRILGLDRPSGLATGFSRDEFERAVRGHELSAGELTGTHGR